MIRNLEPIYSLLASTRSRFISTVDAFPTERWRESPADEVWSAAEVVTHTMQVEESILAASKRALAAGPKPIPFLKRFHPPMALASLRRKKFKSPIRLDERRIPEKNQYQERITETRKATLDFIASTADKNLSVYSFPHPAFGPLNLYSWFRLIAYHEIRHAKQIREVAEIFHQ
jgi:uncharacterized damage-inducible protein DinB